MIQERLGNLEDLPKASELEPGDVGTPISQGRGETTPFDPQVRVVSVNETAQQNNPAVIVEDIAGNLSSIGAGTRVKP